MKAVFFISLLTFKEGVRHRVIIGAVISSILMVFVAMFGSGLFMRDILKVLLDISLSSITIAGLLIPFFYTIGQLSGDIELKSIYSILSRNISRSQYIFGRFTGVSLLSLVLITILLIATAIAIAIAKSIYPEHFFISYALTPIIISTLLTFFSISILNAVAIFWSTITTSSFLATLLTIGTYVIGQTIEDLVKFTLNNAEAMEITANTALFLKSVMYIFPNFAMFDYKQYAAYGINIPHHEFYLLLAYSMAYSTVLLILAISIFRNRDL